MSGPVLPPRGRPEADRAGERGAVLLLVLLAVLLLTVAVLGSRGEVNLLDAVATGEAERLQTACLARSGVTLVQKAFAEDDPASDSLSDGWAAANQMEAIPVQDLGWVTAKVEDEEGKFDVNWLVSQSGEADTRWTAHFQLLLVQAGLDPGRSEEITASLIDWIDPDGTPGVDGAEEEYYAALPHPYAPANARFRTVGELALVRGIGADLLWRGEGDIPPLAGLLTVYGNRDRKVNANTAPVQVLSALSESLDQDLAEEIVSYRKDTPFSRVDDLRSVPGMADVLPAVSPLLTVATSHIMVTVTGENPRASSRARAVLERQGKAVRLVYYRGF